MSEQEHDTGGTAAPRGEGGLKARRLAILDDYHSVALACADWAKVESQAEISVFTDHMSDEDALVERLAPFDALCVMRERTPLPRSLLQRLPRLRFVASTGPVNPAIDQAAAAELGIEVANTAMVSTSTIELTWALILASQRHLVGETSSLRAGGWQKTLGRELSGRTLGLLGLGRIGGAVARIGTAFAMEVIGWSENLTAERAAEVGATAVAKEQLLSRADILSIHMRLSPRTRGLVNGAALASMKRDAWLVNTSRGALVETTAVVRALESGALAGYAVDVFDEEPLAADHPFRTLPNVVATPHIGYVAHDLYRLFYSDAARTLSEWLERADASDKSAAAATVPANS